MTDDPALDEVLREIFDRNRVKLLDRLRRVRAAMTGEAATGTEELRRDVHALVGALGTYGWADGSELLAEVQKTLDAEGDAVVLLGPLDRLIERIERSPTIATRTP